MQPKPAFKWIMRFVAVLVIICALGQIANWHPFGVGAMIRSGLSVVGIIGAILLLCGRRLAWPILIAWGAVQTVVWITDPGGPWFHQTLMMGTTSQTTITNNNMITRQTGQGVNLAGPIWVAIFLAMRYIKWFPRLKLMSKPAWLTFPVRIGALLILLLVSAGWYVQRYRAFSQAPLVIVADIPWTKVYFEDQYLGRTPLIVTPERIRQWNLPLPVNGPLEMFTSNWTQRPVIYSTRKNSPPLILDFQSPFYAPSPRTFPTPWGVRHAVLGGHEDGPVQKFTLRYVNHEVAPWLDVELLEQGPYEPNQIIKVKCTLTNPENETHEGESSRLKIMMFSFKRPESRENGMVPPGSKSRTFEMEPTWNKWPQNTSRTVTVDLKLPEEPGYYTLMSIYNLMAVGKRDRLVFGSPYSNYEMIEIRKREPVTATPNQP